MALKLFLQKIELPKRRGGNNAFYFCTATHAIVRNGLEPVFCDINEDDFTIDSSKIEALITDCTDAIMLVHTYGNIYNIEEI